MSTFWTVLAKAAVRLAVYAAGHPEAVKALIDDGKKVVGVAKGK